MTIPSWARVGAKVVCISTWTNPPGYNEVGPIAGKIYTIRSIAEHWLLKEAPCLLVQEIVNKIYHAPFEGYETCFGIERFRPFVTRTQEQDVAAIRKLVDDMPITEQLDRIGELL